MMDDGAFLAWLGEQPAGASTADVRAITRWSGYRAEITLRDLRREGAIVSCGGGAYRGQRRWYTRDHADALDADAVEYDDGQPVQRWLRVGEWEHLPWYAAGRR